MNILITGATGQLAQDLAAELRAAGDELTCLTHAQLDIADAPAVRKRVKETAPECIINTAAFHRVDACEDEVEKAFAVNAGGAKNLAQAAQGAGATLVQFSSDYVFDGAKNSPYQETDLPQPLSVYGMSRLAGEWAAQQYCQRALVVRTCGLYGVAGSASKGGNFVETMLRLASSGEPISVVKDQIVTPTSTRDLADKLIPLIHQKKCGLFHMTNAGECSWYEFAQEILRLAGVRAEVKPTTTAAFGAKARRPGYSVLDNARLRAEGFPDFRYWKQALADYFKARHAAHA